MLISCIRALLIYLVLIWAVRLSGKRQLGQMAPAEFVVTMLIANLAGIPMEDGDVPMLAGLSPILAVLGAELCLSWLTLASPRLRRLLCGRPVILIENGRLLRENLRKTRISLEELLGQLRLKDVLSIDQVQFAILETAGGISVFPYPEELPPTARDAGITPGPRSLPVTLTEDGAGHVVLQPREEG